MANAAEVCADLKETLTEENKVIGEKKVVVDAMIVEITEKSEIAGKKQKEAAVKKAELSI